MNLVAELKWRGMIQDIMPGTEDQLNKEMTTGYIGFDPTSDSLHIGSLVPILLLVHMQRAGHKPIALVGGATGMIGDPSGKSEERSFLSEDQLQKNLDGIKKQLMQFLDFDAAKPNAAEMANNYDWFKEISFIQFLRDAGKHITVNYMMAKDSVRKRIEGETGISYTEFAYQLMQGYDFYWLYQRKNCKLQMGGSDQWGNITTGTEFIRRKMGGEAFALTCPLLTKADGGKFGKSEKGNVWLSAEKTSPYEFYQFWLNAADADAEKWIKIFTFLPQETINQLIEDHRKDAAARLLQKTLAKEVTVFVHGDAGLQAALETTKKIFEQKEAPAESLSVEDLQNLEGVQQFGYELSKVQAGIDVVTFLAETKIFPSKGEARKMVQGGGVSINRKKVEDEKLTVTPDILLHGQYMLVNKGKKHVFLVKVS
ncbi:MULTISPECIES: tyrosine--tRNA ligase [Niastella]|uniref:Tyrosine--tRNA ligase n=1 Tax=Niastella soli TaxID=2821487 RepID=A0ABS3Z1M1_9BACT|nr:tyrosine--tRNA ligase [Niastella soli]MBO9203291.1 tyrosine--tRNA ligase [Niastella soli]